MKRIFWWASGIILVALYLTSCLSETKEAKGPSEAAFKKPVTKPFEFSEAEAIKWEITDPDSIQPPKSYPLDLDKIPAQPFTINEFKPLKSPMKEYKLDWDNQPSIPLRFDTLDRKPKASILPKPVITKVNKPSIVEGTTSGLLQLSQSEGLPSNEIKSIIQNEDGTFWIATYNGGLCHYTGEYLYTYDYTNIYDIASDQKGRLWLGVGDGVYILDFKKNIQWFYSGPLISDLYCDHLGTMWMVGWRNGVYTLDGDLQHLCKISNEGFERTRRFLEDRNHNLWLGMGDHIRIIGKERNGFKKMEGTEEWKTGGIISFYEDQKGNVWIDGTNNRTGPGVMAMSFSLENKTMKTLGVDNGFHGIARLMEEDDRGRIWLMQNDTTYILSEDRSQIKTIVTTGTVISSGRIGYAMKDDRGNIWLGTHNKGVILADPDGFLPEHLNSQQGLMNDEVWSIKEDSRGDIWLGTRAGINIYDPAKGTIKAINHSSLGTPASQSNQTIQCIKEFEKDKIFTDGVWGFTIIDRAEKVLTRYIEEQNIATRIEDAIKDEDGTFWLATVRGLAVYNPELNWLKAIPDSSEQLLASERVRCIVDDGLGHYWLGTTNGLVIIDPTKNTIKHLREQEGLCNNNIMKLVLREDGQLWVATIDGISVIDLDDKTITNLGEAEGLIPDEIYDLQEKEGILYAGSVNGLIQITNSSDKNAPWLFKNYSLDQGLTLNDYHQDAGTVLKNGQMWLPATGQTTGLTILTQDPVPDSTACPVQIASIHIMDAELSFDNSSLHSFFESNDTLWHNDGKQFYLEHTLSRDSGYVFENNIRWDSLELPLNLPQGLELPYHQNSIRFSYANLCALDRNHISYKYILEGADNNWTYIGDKPATKNYYNLTPGRYTFKVSSKGFNDLWSDPDELPFSILPPWWKTWWAYLLYAIMAIVGVSAIVQYRSKKLQEENHMLEEKVSKRTSELRETINNLKATQTQLIQSEKMASLGELTAGIAHEIQNPLNFVNNFSEVSTELLDEMKEEIENGDYEEVKMISKDLKQNLEKIHHHGKRADSIVKGMLQHSRTSTGLVEPTDLNALTDEYLRLSYHGLRAKDKTFNATMHTDFDESLGKVEVVAQDLGRVILNLITNAFYTVDKKAKKLKSQDPSNAYKPTVTVSTRRMGDQVNISVADNGNGIPPDIMDKIFQPFFTTKPTGEGTGLGLSMSYEIIKNGHGGDLKVQSTEGEGTTFTIELHA